MKTLLASADPKARLAIEMYCLRIARELGSLAAALGGIAALVKTVVILAHGLRTLWRDRAPRRNRARRDGASP